jgi:hypothetical protein
MAASFAPIWINRATVGNLIIKDLTVLTTTPIGSAASAIYVTSNGSVGSLRVSGLDLENSAGVANTSSPVVLAGTVNQASFRDTRINQGTTQFAGPAISCTGTVGDLQVDGGVYDHINNVVGVSAGTTSLVSASNLIHTNTSGGSTFAQTGGTFSGLAYTPGVLAALPTSGTIGNVVDGITNTYETAVMSASTSIPGSTFSSMGISVTLPTPGTYMLSGVGRCSFTVNGALGQGVYVVVQLYDTTNSVAVPNSPVLLILADLQVASTNVQFQQSSTIGPVFYTTTSANVVIQLQAMINGTGTITSPYLNSDSNGWTSISAVRIA